MGPEVIAVGEFLQTYGPWAISAICFYAIARMYRDVKAHNKALTSILERTIGIIQANTDALREVRRVLEKRNGSN